MFTRFWNIFSRRPETMTAPEKDDKDVVSPSAPSQVTGTADAPLASPANTAEGDAKTETSPATESSESEESYHQSVLDKLAILQTYLERCLTYKDKNEKGELQRIPLLPKLKPELKQDMASIKENVQKLAQELLSVKEQLSYAQSQSQQIDNQVREVAEISKKRLHELEEACKEKFAKIVWESLFCIEDYSNDDVIEEITCDATGFEKLKKIIRDIKSDVKMMLEQDFGTKAFDDPIETTVLDNQRHQVNHGMWVTTVNSEKHRRISRTFRCGVEDLVGKIMFRQRVAAYDYRPPANQPEQCQTDNTTNQPEQQ